MKRGLVVILFSLIFISLIRVVGAINYIETFDTPGALGTTWIPVNIQGNPTWSITGGNLKFDPGTTNPAGKGFVFYNGGMSWTDYNVTVPILNPVDFLSAEVGQPGILFYYTSINNYYKCELWWDYDNNEGLRLSKVVGGTETIINSTVGSGLSNAPFYLNVNVQGTNINCYAADNYGHKFQLSAVDNSLSSGTIAAYGNQYPFMPAGTTWNEFQVNDVPVTPPSGSCPPNQTIMKLFSQNNSHGALWNQSYTYDICYSTIFGDEYTGTSSHTCTGANKVLGLYQTSNSHAEIPSLNNYPVDVCYGDLTCIGDSSAGNTCSDISRNVVVRLYQNNNSHISYASDTNYPIKICCKSTTTPTTTEVYWANTAGNPITTASIGDTVFMVYKDKAGSDYDFDVIEHDPINPDEIRTVTDNFDFNGHLAAKWIITQIDFDKGSDTGELADGEENFRFIVDGKESEDLIVREGSYNNTPPSTQIINPISETNYTINKITGFTGDISFEQISSDEDDDLRLIWNFGDGQTQIFENIFATGEGNTMHKYDLNNWGRKLITLRAEEMTRNQWDDDTASIYVYREGINVFAVIDSPPTDEVQHITGRAVNIDAKRSHAADCNYSLAACVVKYGAGNCYEVVDGSTSSNPSLYCYKLPQQNLIMEWTFDIGTPQEEPLSGVYGTVGDENTYGKVVEFPWVFSLPGEHTLNLRVGYVT